MKFLIPGKTFLVGEYLALTGGPAILLNTSPCFEVTMDENLLKKNIHPDSPAGKFLKYHSLDTKINFHDPFNGLGGLGASSAEFLGAYLIYCHVNKLNPSLEELLNTYFNFLDTKGIKPSGYDVLSQSLNHCVYINKNKSEIFNYPWSFEDISFALFHTGRKLKTHLHLNNFIMPDKIKLNELAKITELAQNAFITKNSELLINSINLFNEKLFNLNLIAPHTLEIIQHLKNVPDILAIKGCGAMGADIILIIFENNNREKLFKKLLNCNLFLVGSELYTKKTLINLK